MCNNHKHAELKVLRTYGIELEGYTYENIRGNYVKDWKLVHDGSLNDGRESCESCNGNGEREYECSECYGTGNYECYKCDGSGAIYCPDCDGEGCYDCGDCDGEGGKWDENDNWVECENCNDGKIDCNGCNGEGELECPECEGNGNVPCGDCGGDGYYNDECNDCYGSGYFGDEEEGCGVECVSGILNEGDYEPINRIFDYTSRYDWYVNSDCGTHIHVGASDLEASDLSKLYLLQNIIEPFIYGISPTERINGNYAKRTNRNIADSFMRIGSQIDMQQLADYYYGYSVRLHGNFGRYDSARYYGINLHSYFYRKLNGSPTVEFRYFEGCDNREQASAWVDLCIKLVDFAKYSTFEQLLVIGRELVTVENLTDYIAKVKDLLGIEYNFVPQSEYAFNVSRSNIASVFRDTHVITRAV